MKFYHFLGLNSIGAYLIIFINSNELINKKFHPKNYEKSNFICPFGTTNRTTS